MEKPKNRGHRWDKNFLELKPQRLDTGWSATVRMDRFIKASARYQAAQADALERIELLLEKIVPDKSHAPPIKFER